MNLHASLGDSIIEGRNMTVLTSACTPSFSESVTEALGRPDCGAASGGFFCDLRKSDLNSTPVFSIDEAGKGWMQRCRGEAANSSRACVDIFLQSLSPPPADFLTIGFAYSVQRAYKP